MSEESRKTILIVEDDANLREALLETLQADELPVLSADNGPRALEILNSEPVGLVISDLQMEPMQLQSLLHHLVHLFCPHTQIIVAPSVFL